MDQHMADAHAQQAYQQQQAATAAAAGQHQAAPQAVVAAAAPRGSDRDGRWTASPPWRSIRTVSPRPQALKTFFSVAR